MAFTSINNLKEKLSKNQLFIKYGEYIIAVDYNRTLKWYVAYYNFIDSPDDFEVEECRLENVDLFGCFEDSGHAIEWAINEINK